MNAELEVFVDCVLRVEPFLAATVRGVNEYWYPEEPPITTLFGEIGDAIAHHIKDGNSPNAELFELIENAMQSGEDDLVTAVATGLVEALGANCESDEELRQRMLRMFGPSTRRHYDAWAAF